jgi:hypothetical protein
MTRTVPSLNARTLACARIAPRKHKHAVRLRVDSLESRSMPGDMRGPLTVMAGAFSDVALMAKNEAPAPTPIVAAGQAPAPVSLQGSAPIATSPSPAVAETKHVADSEAAPADLPSSANTLDIADLSVVPLPKTLAA